MREGRKGVMREGLKVCSPQVMMVVVDVLPLMLMVVIVVIVIVLVVVAMSFACIATFSR